MKLEQSRKTDTGLLILRVSLGVMMLLHGIAKLMKGTGGIEGLMSQSGLPGFLAYGVYVGEVLAPILLIIGYRVRLAALLFMATMAVAVLLAHAHDIFSLTNSGGWGIELQAQYFFGALALYFTGGGKLAVSTGNKWD